MSVNQTHTKTTREMFWATGAAEFAGPHLDGVPAIRPLRTFQDRTSYASLTKGPAVFAGGGGADLVCVWAANWRLGCKLAFGLQTGVRQRIGVWAANWRLGCNWSSGCKMTFEFFREQAIRTFRRRTSYASLTTGPAGFAGLHLDCVPATRPFGLFGAAHRMLPC